MSSPSPPRSPAYPPARPAAFGSPTPRPTDRVRELYVYGPEWSLPTFHADCLVVITYVHFAGLERDIKISECTNPSMSPSGDLPFLRDGDDLIGGALPIIAHLKRRGDNIDFRLTPRENADVRAYTSLVMEELSRCMLYNWWAESENYTSLTARVYSLGKPFPLSWWLPNRQRDALVDVLKQSGYADETVYARANEAYIALAERLGDSPYFGGAVPCTLDALVFGHLFVAYLSPMPVAHLSFQIATHPNLTRYLQGVYKLFWHLDIGSSPAFVTPSPIRSDAAVRAWSSSPRASPSKRRRAMTPNGTHSDFFEGDETVDDDEGADMEQADEPEPAAGGAGPSTAEGRAAAAAASAASGGSVVPGVSRAAYEREVFAKRTRMFVAVGIVSVLAYVTLYLGGSVAGVAVADDGRDDE